jgi:hypothetical protein
LAQTQIAFTERPISPLVEVAISLPRRGHTERKEIA